MGMPRPNWKLMVERQNDEIVRCTDEIIALNDKISALQAEVAVLNKLAIRDAAAHHMIVDSARLGNIAYSAMAKLMDHELGDVNPEVSNVTEAQVLLEFKKAIALKVDYIIIRVTRDDPV